MPLLSHQSIQPFIEYLKFEKRYSLHTLTAYQADLSEFIGFINSQFGSTDMVAINHIIIRSWLALLKDHGLTAKSLNRKISTLKSFFKYLLKNGVIEINPMAKVISPKIGKRLPVFVKEQDVKILIGTLNSSTENWRSLNARMIITIFYATGMRLSELINLKEKQVDFARSQIKVLGKGNKERIIPISDELAGKIKEYQQLKRKEFETFIKSRMQKKG